MITRIVKLTFREDFLEEAFDILRENEDGIRNYDGCTSLEILKDVHNKRVVMTYSLWTSETHLNHYRNSDFFKGIWARLKAGFDDRAQAWSLKAVNP